MDHLVQCTCQACLLVCWLSLAAAAVGSGAERGGSWLGIGTMCVRLSVSGAENQADPQKLSALLRHVSHELFGLSAAAALAAAMLACRPCLLACFHSSVCLQAAGPCAGLVRQCTIIITKTVALLAPVARMLCCCGFGGAGSGPTAAAHALLRWYRVVAGGRVVSTEVCLFVVVFVGSGWERVGVCQGRGCFFCGRARAL